MTRSFIRIGLDALLAAMIVGIFVFISSRTAPEPAPTPQIAAAPAAFLPSPALSATTTPAATTTTTTTPNATAKKPAATTTPIKKASTPAAKPVAAPVLAPNQVARIQKPYDAPVKTVEAVNAAARLATVNILCDSENGSIKPISASGVLVDERGVIITNAHVAQYVLLATDPAFGISCAVRTNSPAARAWTVAPLFIPKVWIQTHAADIVAEHAKGTGEHDFGLLYVTGSAGKPLPSSFPGLPIDTRNAIGFTEDQVLVVSYPAELVGGFTARNNLYAVSSVTTVKNLMTFTETLIDMISLGGIIGAQGGSSGGAVVNAWGYLIGIVTTTTEGATTADRDLRAITLAHIDRDMRAFTGNGLQAYISQDLGALQDDFTRNTAPDLLTYYRQLLR